MSGHNKWSSIKHKKAAADAAKGKVFTKVVKEITVAARMGGGDPVHNPRLRSAISAAKAASMPSANIERAIKKGTGELEGLHYEEIVYEGYGPGGVAIMVEATTDNKNRTNTEVRTAFNKLNGNLGSAGCVSYMFKHRGVFVFNKANTHEDKLMEFALEIGADDVIPDEDIIIVYTEPSKYYEIKDLFDKQTSFTYESTELTKVSETRTKVEQRDAETLAKLIDKLDDLDDVQNVYHNVELDDTFLNAMG